jgi:hypothetical protein
LALTLDPDGGDGEWLARLQAEAPTLSLATDAPQGFSVATLAPGRWEVRRDGAWKGERGGIFDDRVERVPLTIAWAPGGDPQVLQVPVTVPARWGRMGWVLVALAGVAVLLLGFIVASHRVAPLTGTLLYTIQGVDGAVGRLPLAGAGRRRTAVTADARGRLTLGGGGPAVFHLRPTRVGGMVELPGESGQVETRLLVDGLSFCVGRHAVRYVQAGREGSAQPPVAPESGPDLLGPEYDLPYSTKGDARG